MREAPQRFSGLTTPSSLGVNPVGWLALACTVAIAVPFILRCLSGAGFNIQLEGPYGFGYAFSVERADAANAPRCEMTVRPPPSRQPPPMERSNIKNAAPW